MIPISLTIEGLYSYQESQTIDFDSLIQAGLFGIFGKVGSGKSSLLEAISFALYGETERLNAKDNRAYNMMNLKSNRAVIDFEFYNFEQKKHRIYREFKRNTKRFDDVKRTEAIFYQWDKDKWVPLDHVNAELVLGLSYENFKRTIIIPQGKFKEFIELGGTARTRMMQELFGLERFNLSDNVRRLYLENKESLDRLQGAIQAYENVDTQQISSSEEVLKQQDKTLENHTKSLNTERELLQQLKIVKQTFEELLEQQTKLKTLQAQESEIRQKEQDLELYVKAQDVFQNLFIQVNDLDQQSTRITQQKTLVQSKAAQYTKDLTAHQAVLAGIESSYQRIDQDKKIAFELGLVSTIIKAQELYEKCLLRLNKGEPMVVEYENQISEIQKQILLKTEELKELKNKRVPTTLVLELGQWYTDQERLERQIKQEVEKTKATQEKILLIQAERKLFDLDDQNWKQELATRFKDLQKQEAALQLKRNQLEVSQQLSHYTLSIKHGEPCPLCGALEHPQVTNTEDLTDELSAMDHQIQQHQLLIQQHVKLEREMESISERIRLYQIQGQDLEQNLNRLEVELKNHQECFKWNDFAKNDSSNYLKVKQTALSVENSIENLENSLEQQTKVKDTLEGKSKLYQNELDKIRKEALEWQMQIQTLEKQLGVLILEDFQGKTAQEIQESKDQLEQQIIKVQKLYQETQFSLSELKPKVASELTLLEQYTNDLKEIQQQRQALDLKINELVQFHGFVSLEQVRDILNQTINPAHLRELIQNYRIQKGTLVNLVESLKQKIGDSQFDLSLYQTQEVLVANLEQLVKDSREKSIELRTTLEALKESFEIKKELESKQNQLLKRAANIQVMSNLFKASGFVNYVSSIYLKNLCDRANTRFHRLTKNQLSLHLNSNNDFEIIDYLNNGKTRSVKTLSGGQSFQVSLSLALALAESVQSLSASDKNFFFIDEGFGTQDSESVDIVFETLQNLNKENRVVGIISHVEELQERIPVSLTVTKELEKGSIITTSYQ